MKSTTLTMNAIGLSFGLVLLTSCTSTNGMSNVTPQYVPPSTYQNYDCSALNSEYNRITTYIDDASKRTSSLTTTGIGVGISAGRWGISPNISVGLGKSANANAGNAKLSRLYGERDAVVQSARLNDCQFATGLKTYGE